MIYRVTFREAPAIYLLGGALSACLLVGGFWFYPGSLLAVLCGFVVFAWMVAVRWRCFVCVSGDSLEVGTLLGRACVRWAEINSVRRKGDTGFLASRLFGPHVYEFATSTSRFRINFKLYPLACAQEVLGRLEPGVVNGQNDAVCKTSP
jgi:hypothetical protein